jgi:hypothetical protein
VSKKHIGNPTAGTEEDHKKLQDSWCPESRFEQGTSIIQDYSVTARLTHMVNQSYQSDSKRI